MKYNIVSIIISVMIISCTKKDILFYKKYIKENKCQVVSGNRDRQRPEDFFLIKTYDKSGKLMHIQTQLKDIYEQTFVYDYAISYSKNKATFRGTTTQTFWAADLENDPNPELNDPPLYLESQELIDARDFEVLLDPGTWYARELRYVGSSAPLVTIKYDSRNYIDSINDFDVTTDKRGNILSIFAGGDPQEIEKFGHLGVSYGYNDLITGHKRQFYEPANIFVHDKYTLLEVLDWGPFQPDRERNGYDIMWAYPPGEGIPVDVNVTTSFRDHIYDTRGN